MEIHTLANIFPKMQEGEFEKLVEDVKANGVLEPIWIFENKIIDGRHRFFAAQKLEIDCPKRQYEGSDPLGFVLSLNLRRRHLNESQRAMVAAKLANLPKGANQHTQICAPTQEKAAEMLSVSKRTVQSAKELQTKCTPETVKAVQEGEITIHAALKEQKKHVHKEKINQQRKDIQENAVKQPDGLFDVLVIDPPWAYGREYDPENSRVANPYPEMNQQELLALELPSKSDCVIFLWTTHAFIWDAKALLDAWGYTYKATMVWDKEKIGMGATLRMQCEFCLVGFKGKPFWQNTEHRDIIRESRRQHSRKPDAFYEIVDKITAGRKLDFFSRQKREGWESFGNDTDKFSD